MRAKNPVERFWSMISPEPNSGCWLWDGGNIKTQKGYYQIGVNGKLKQVHRFAYERYRGPVPPGLLVCHTCDVRCCVNPDHLFLGTPADNTADMIRKGRMPRGKGRWNAKLTDQQVLEIKTSPLSSYVLGERYKISARTIRKIRQRRIWTHV